MDPITLAIIGFVLTALFGAPAWFPYLSRLVGKSGDSDNEESLTDHTGVATAGEAGRVTTEYLNDLIQRASTLSFGDPSSWASTSGADEAGIVTLDQVWTPLRAADSQIRASKTGPHENMTEEDAGEDLRHLVSNTEEALLILGDPGSGKSTSVSFLALEGAKSFSRDANELLPIWVNLASVAIDDEATIEEALLSGVPEISVLSARGGREAEQELHEELSNAIAEGRALLLLDGLDEVPEHHLSKTRKIITDILNRESGNKTLVTCRTFDYRQARPNRKIPILRELELLPFSVADQQAYVEKWYDAAIRVGRFTKPQAEELKAALLVELRLEEIAELGSSPLLLALLTLIHSEEAKLPDTRAVVADKAITYMLADAAKWRVRQAGASTVATPPVLALAIAVAYECHAGEEETGIQESGIRVADINKLSAKICSSMADVEQMRDVPEPDTLVDRFLNSHGLVLEFGEGRYRFAHRSFQEFLSGQYFAAGAHHEEAIQKALSPHWREPFRLMASLAGHDGQNLYYVLKLIEDILTSQSSDISGQQLGCEMLSEIGRRRLALRSFDKVLEDSTFEPGGRGLWQHAVSLVSAHIEDENLPLAARERSATVIGSLGDPRFAKRDSDGFHFPALTDVSPGERRLGTDRIDQTELVNSGGIWWQESRTIDLLAFKIGRYLVTNIEFHGFIESGGYANSEYWLGNMASGWVSGDSEVLEMIKSNWLDTAHEHHAKEIRDGEINEEFLEDEALRRVASRSHPFYWLDRRFNRPNQPVVGINWWEAKAYCQWATERSRGAGLISNESYFDLPTEFEWEFASRPKNDDRIYPWGDHWDEQRAHVTTNILNMRSPCPVGIYLEHWPGGPCDMAGNVWEWTDSLEKPYAAKFDGQRSSNESLDERVVRGSSWYNKAFMTACSARAIDRSYNLFYDVGFRMVLIDHDLIRP